ncbi:MAG: hypothetical protein ACREDR_22935 [Blastocatellia bacterium]
MGPYKPLNLKNIDAHPQQSTRARILSATDVREWLSRTGQKTNREGTATVTFVVDLDGYLWIADRHSEHVACAEGRDVLSAGELTFEVSNLNLVVLEATNQSIGYCPEPQSWAAVSSALDRNNIGHPGCFTAEFIFRRCLRCNETNVVKDEWYRCAVCDEALSKEWNCSTQ